MCGHGTIGLVATLAHLGRIAPGTHRIETPVGVVTVDARTPTARSRRQRAELSRTHKDVQRRRARHRRRAQATSPGAATGSSWSSDHGQELSLANVDALTELLLAHPPGAERAGPSATSITSSCSARRRRRRERAQLRAVSRARPTTARRAAPARAPSSPASPPTASWRKASAWVQESIIGSMFTRRYRWLDRARGTDRARPSPARAYVTAEATLLLDDDDPVLLGHPLA